MNGIMNLKDINSNFNQHLDELLSDIVLPSENELAEETKAEKVSLALKGRKHSDATKKKWSEIHTGKSISEEHQKKWIDGRKTQAWNDLLQKYPKDMLVAAAVQNGNHLQNTIISLKIGFETYKKLCKHYGLTILKKSITEKSEWAKTHQATPIKVYENVNGNIGKLLYEFESVALCCKKLQLHKGNLLRNIANNKPYHNMFFVK